MAENVVVGGPRFPHFRKDKVTYVDYKGTNGLPKYIFETSSETPRNKDIIKQGNGCQFFEYRNDLYAEFIVDKKQICHP